ncbi:Membrane anchor Opy2 N-terminal [Penicillium malachiteum]|nr:Membrane anchor Opy2 N-terminal [Penicillium malachiteum]
MSFQPVDSNSFTGFDPAFSLFKRCVTCSDSSPSCPVCESGYTCSMTSQSCTTCASTKCVASAAQTTTASSQPKSGGVNVGAIAGGVVGGLIAIALILFLIWWFAIRGKRQERAAQQEKSSQFSAARSARQSTQSIASTVLTRASNVIQIAYIPGVTNRSPPETPATLVPPVPPLPGAHPDQHFFMPGDLRDSSWTTLSGAGHQSMSPTLRSSVATTIYRNDAIVSAVPAQQISRSRANIVSVHSGLPSGANTPDFPGTPVVITPADAPAVPAITSAQLAKAGAFPAAPSPVASNSGSSIVARTVTAKPVMVRGPSLKKKAKDTSSADERLSATNSAQFDHQTSTFDGSSSDEDDTPPSTSSSNNTAAKKGIPTISIVEVPETPEEHAENASPFSDQKGKNSSSTDTAKRSSWQSAREAPSRVESPFSDVNEVRL